MPESPSDQPLAAPIAQGAYVPVRLHGGMAFTAGATPRVDGELVLVGRIGAELNFDEATRALEIATRNAVGSLLGAVDTDRVEQVLQMTVYLRCVETFSDHTRLADAASRVLVDAFGQGAPPARTVVGVSSLPAGAAVEVSIIAAIKTGRTHIPGAWPVAEAGGGSPESRGDGE